MNRLDFPPVDFPPRRPDASRDPSAPKAVRAGFAGSLGFDSPPLHPDASRDLSDPLAVRAGFAGSLTRLSLADRDLVCQDREVVAARGADGPTGSFSSSADGDQRGSVRP